MNKHLSKQELADVATKYPVNNLMSRDDKLERLAELAAKVPFVHLFDRIEDMTQKTKEKATVKWSIFDLAMQDPVFRAAGLQGSTVAHGQRFFELSNEELHHLSCNCGGAIHPNEMAQRLRSMKGGAAPAVSRQYRDGPLAIFLMGLGMWAVGAALAYQFV